jgi:hypothetical protein
VAEAVGLISRGEAVVQTPDDCAVQPIMIVTVVPAVTALVVVTQSSVGAVTVEEAPQVTLLVIIGVEEPFHAAPALFKLLKANVVADGEAVLFALPGKVIVIWPPTGIVDGVIKEMVWVAVIGTKSTSVPPCTAAPVVFPRYTDVNAPDCEATVSPWVIILLVLLRITFALSDAK